MALLYELINEERNFGMTKTLYSLFEGETNQEFAEFTDLLGSQPVFDNSLL